MGRGIRRSVLVAGLALGAMLLPSGAGGVVRFPEDRCEYIQAGPPGPTGNRLAVFGFSYVYVRRDGPRIEVAYHGPRCTGPQATIWNTDRIFIRSEGEEVVVDESEGRLAPGATAERHSPEIEIAVSGRIEYQGGDGRDEAVASTLKDGRIGIDLDPAADRGKREYDLVSTHKPPAVLKLRGNGGPDLISTRGVTNMGDLRLRRVIRLFGGPGNDTILGGPHAEWRIRDGHGDDRVHGGGGFDEILTGRGRDTVFGGKGPDLIEYGVWERFSGRPPDVSDRFYGGPGDDSISDYNRSRDFIDCGPGRDRYQREPRDPPGRDCEEVRR